MSVLSAQVDELRTMAESVGLAVPQAATLMMEAADTIWELRDRAQALKAENVNLREELEAVGIAAYSYGRGDLKAENAKLRELVRDMYKWLWNGADCTECPFAAKCDLNAAFESDIHAHICLGWSEIHDRMRELGVVE